MIAHPHAKQFVLFMLGSKLLQFLQAVDWGVQGLWGGGRDLGLVVCMGGDMCILYNNTHTIQQHTYYTTTHTLYIINTHTIQQHTPYT